MIYVSSLVSIIALTFSAYGLWETSLKRSELKVFVAPVIRYASPYQNTNFEVFAIPVTISNEGARTGTIMSMALEVSDGKRSKRFYSADLGQWSIEKARTGDFRPYVPIPLPGRSSYTDVILFHARNDEAVMQIVEAAGTFKFRLTLDAALSEDFGPIDQFWRKEPRPLSFEMILPELDHRAFTSGSGTVALHQRDWQSTVQAD
ncbi:MAG TPA: hypothetical protein VIY51_09370 [Xanthobacteraceae bacterium]